MRCSCFILCNLLTTNYRRWRLFCTHCSANLFLPAHDQGIFWRWALLISPLEAVQVQSLSNTQRFMRCLSTVTSLQAMISIWVVAEINLISLKRLGIRRFSGLQGTQFEFLGLIAVDGLRAFQLRIFIFVGLSRLPVCVGCRLGCRWGPRTPQLGWNVKRIFRRNLGSPVRLIDVVVVVAHIHQTASNLNSVKFIF